MKYYFQVLKSYAVFRGRSPRAEYWYFTLFNTIFFILLAILDTNIGLFDSEELIGLTSGIYAAIIFIPSLAVTVRRLHDSNRSAWYLLFALIPIVGTVILWIGFMLIKSAPGSNKYGPSPITVQVPDSQA